MPVYKVTLPSGACTVQDGNNSVLVFAADANDAKALAGGFSSGDAAPWASATVADVGVEATNFLGVRVEITVTPVAGAPVVFSAEGDGDDTVDDIGAKLAAAGVAAGRTVTYTAGTDVLAVTITTETVTAKTYKKLPGGDDFLVTSMAPTVAGGNVTITPLGTGVNPVFIMGGKS